MTQAERDLRPDTRARLRAPVGHRWAVIVGISRYASPQLTLQYAHRDAENSTSSCSHRPAGRSRRSGSGCCATRRRRRAR